jgi:hypothetical protein
MADRFVAETLVETSTGKDRRRLEMTFVNAEGGRHTVSLPVAIAADLLPVLRSLLSGTNGSRHAQFTKLPKQLAIASARHERLVLLRFDDEPPYGLALDEAESLWRGVREEAATISRLKAPLRQ